MSGTSIINKLIAWGVLVPLGIAVLAVSDPFL